MMWQRLFADVRDDAARLVTHLQPRGRRCLDSDTRMGHAASLLEEGGASLVWLADSSPILPDRRRRRFVSGELPWLARHPHLLADGPEHFDLVLSAHGLWRSAGPEPGALVKALAGARALLAPGGTFAMTTPAEPAPPAPIARLGSENADDLVILEVHVEGLRYEVRSVRGVAPLTTVGRDVVPKELVTMLGEAGFDTPQVLELSEHRLGIVAKAI